MTPGRTLVLPVILVLALFSSGGQLRAAAQPPQDPLVSDISPEALAQIAALLEEKQARTPTQQKIDSQLIYERKMESGQPVANGIWAVETDLSYADDGHLVVDVRARAGSDLASRLPAAGIEVEFASTDGSDVRAHLEVDQLEALAADPDVLFIQPMQQATVSGQEAAPNFVPPTGQGSRSSEGDLTHLAFAARGVYHTDGAGVKIGVLSDGVRNLAASQAAGDLGQVTVIGPASPCAAARTCDEGTAMLEIVHDLAPGAQLYFASAFVSITSFADNIRALRAAGCDIIVDDVFYFVETPFQDGQPRPTNRNAGVVIQAVNDVTADGALYLSSAGNSGNLDGGTSGVWEGDFADGGAVKAPILAIEGEGARVHTFGTQTFDVLTAAGTTNNLSWSDPLGASANDYDLFRLDAAGTTVLAASVNSQTGTQDPYEQVTSGPAGSRLVVVKFSGAGRFLHLNTNRGRLSIATAGQTHGHNSAAAALGVAATAAPAAFPGPFNAGNTVETFSSDGPRRVFYRGDGTAYTPGNVSATGGIVRQKPDITAGDGVSVTGVGGFPNPFFGTSAAAPHAAAIAALVKSANPSLASADIRAILRSTAIDIAAPGVDRDSGAGIVMALDAVRATGASGAAFLAVDSIIASDHPGNGNGIPEAGEGAMFTVTLKNYGVVPATAISAALASPTAGIAIARPNAVDYPDLAPSASAPNTGGLLFMAASDFGCPGAATFVLNATYGGGGAPLSQAFVLPIGVSSYSVTRALDGTAPAASAGVVTTAGLQVGRLSRDGVVSACGAQKTINSGTAPNPIDAALRRFESYQFTTCPNSSASCASVTFSGPNSRNMFSAAYAPTFNPAAVAQNYKADAGASSVGPLTYSFDLPAGRSQFAVDVHDVPILAAPSNSLYTMTVAGACLGACDPPNHAPVARASNATLAANDLCVAAASIDNGSSDADGDPLTLLQAPPSPYPLGTTSVLLTATDPKGAFGQATASVLVLDRTPPSIVCPAPVVLNTAPGACSAPAILPPPTASDRCSNPTTVSTDIAPGASFALGTTIVNGRATDAAGNDAVCTTSATVVDREPPAVSGMKAVPATLRPRDHDVLVDVTVNYDAADNCGASSCVLTVTSNQPPKRDRDRDDDRGEDRDRAPRPDVLVVDAHHVRLRAKRNDGRDRIYTITVTCTDASGNQTVRTTTVVVPHDDDER